MKVIQLTRGRETLIDDEDFERVSQYKWRFDIGNAPGAKTNPDHTGYGKRTIRLGPPIDGKRQRKSIWMHRFIMDCPVGMITDHINGNGLDNQKSNLRIVTQGQNMNNRKDNVA